MKQLIQFIFPTVKAISAVIGLMFTITAASFYGINRIAKAQAEVIEEEIMAVRNTDYQHINARFDKIDDAFVGAVDLGFKTNVTTTTFEAVIYTTAGAVLAGNREYFCHGAIH